MTTKTPAPSQAPANDAADSELAIYRSALVRAGHDAAGIEENKSLAVGGWRYFHQGPFTNRQHAAAVHVSGSIASATQLDGWFAFFGQPDITLRKLVERIAWILGRAVILDEKVPLKDAAAKKLVQEPTLTTVADTAKLIVWVAYSFAMQQAMRLIVTALKGGKATIETLVVGDIRFVKKAR